MYVVNTFNNKIGENLAGLESDSIYPTDLRHMEL